MTQSKRQPYGFGSFVKKFTRPIKKVLKSPLGKAAVLGGLGYLGLNKLGGTQGWSAGLKKMFSPDRFYAPLFYSGDKGDRKFSLGRSALTGLAGAGILTPYIQKMMKTGPYIEDTVEDEDWTLPSPNLANLLTRTKDYYRDYDPYLSDLSFQPAKQFVDPTFYSAKGGLAKLANGGGVAEAQAEQMLKMQYQKYRNQGGTMSYQQFKMTVLKQAQGQGPMAQGQPQMAAQGGRIGYEDGSRGPHGKTDLEILEELYPTLFSDTTTGIEGAIKKKKYTKGKAQGGRIGLLGGGPVPGSTVPGYTTPVGYNKFDYRTGGIPVRVGRAEGGLMSLGGMEKDYRNEGGFVPLGKKEKADDVPARLSKNEFVFTADAVRNAGGGDIDAGAEVMENVMKNLEAGGQISEESQGAQGMYNNMKQLETRIA